MVQSNWSTFNLCSGILEGYCFLWYKCSSLQVSNDAQKILSLAPLAPRCPVRRDVTLGRNAAAERTRKIAIVNRFFIITMNSSIYRECEKRERCSVKIITSSVLYLVLKGPLRKAINESTILWIPILLYS